MMPFLDREYDCMHAEEAFGQIHLLLKLPASTKYVTQRILRTLATRLAKPSSKQGLGSIY